MSLSHLSWLGAQSVSRVCGFEMYPQKKYHHFFPHQKINLALNLNTTEREREIFKPLPFQCGSHYAMKVKPSSPSSRVDRYSVSLSTIYYYHLHHKSGCYDAALIPLYMPDPFLLNWNMLVCLQKCHLSTVIHPNTWL